MNCHILLLIEKLEGMKLKTEQLTTKKFRLRIIRKVELSRSFHLVNIQSTCLRFELVQQSVRKHPCLDNSNRWSIDIQLLTHWELQTRSTRHRRCLFDKRLSTVWSDAKPCPESSTLTRLC
ncbi:hypothetical protein T06_1336 [Trichinella sp. T6]|nr:hypothetical protein T06_1336 [Trichinella sp. T6]